MAEKTVRHISGHGKVFVVEFEGETVWRVWADRHGTLDLPKSEYVRCDLLPQQTETKRWVDVTAECRAHNRYVYYDYLYGPACGRADVVTGPGCGLHDGYRLRKVRADRLEWAFIVEKEQP